MAAEGGGGMMRDLPQMAISIRQPWAWAIIHAGKDIENRDWKTRFRGPVCIHAAKGMTRAEWDEATYWIRCNFDANPPRLSQLDRGGIIGTAEIVDCLDQSASPWFFGRYGFALRNPRPVEFIPVKGALGFFDWRENISA
jgi:ASCH domain